VLDERGVRAVTEIGRVRSPSARLLHATEERSRGLSARATIAMIERLALPLFVMRPVITSGRLARPRGEQPQRRTHAFADRRGDFVDAEARAGADAQG
jgi:hypothetical protein